MVRQGSPMWPRAEGLRAFSFGDPGTMRRRLTALALAGTKVATAELLKQDYFDKDEAIEKVGERQALLGDDGQIAAVIEITRMEIPRLPRRAVGVCGRGRRRLHFSRALARRALVVLRQTRHRSRRRNTVRVRLVPSRRHTDADLIPTGLDTPPPSVTQAAE